MRVFAKHIAMPAIKDSYKEFKTESKEQKIL